MLQDVGYVGIFCCVSANQDAVGKNFALHYTDSWAKAFQVLQKSRIDAILSEKQEIILVTSQDCCCASFQEFQSLSVYRESLLTIKFFCPIQRGLQVD